MSTRETAVMSALWQAHREMCACGVGDIDPKDRVGAIAALEEAARIMQDGFASMEKWRQREKEEDVIKAYREGRVTIHETVKA